MLVRAATDVGGTFTDLVYCPVDPQTGHCGAVQTTKVDTTPPHFERGVMAALARAGLAPASLSFFAHGATVVINAITERRGATTALITTRGFRDVLEIARGNRPDLFNFNFHKPAPFVPRFLRHEILECVTSEGEVEIAPDLTALPVILDELRNAGVTAIAVCFLNAYRNGINEAAVAHRIRELWPQVSVVASHEVSRQWREYERTSTAVLGAYVRPVVERYVDSLGARLTEAGMDCTLHLMLSSGGIASARTVKNNPIAMVESGPASGVFAAARLGTLIGRRSLLVLDIGGTTAKCSLVEDGNIRVATTYHVERTRKHPGYPIQTPVTDLVEIGNGGGSVAWIDAGGKLHVGPRSAGADPGPIAYGRGGTEPTTTDANLLLGRIDPARFAGGELTPDLLGVERAFEALGRGLGVSAAEAARGVIRIANSNMSHALRRVSTHRGFDPRGFTLVAFGGGGPLHAVALAEDLHVPEVVVPAHSSVFSAWGMLLTDPRRDYVRTHLANWNPMAARTLVDRFRALQSEADDDFRTDDSGGREGDLRFEFFANMRYAGQEHSVTVPIGIGEAGGGGDAGAIDAAATSARFQDLYERQFGYRLEAGIEVVELHLVATRPVLKPEWPTRLATGASPETARRGERRVDFDRHGIHVARVYDGLLLEAGATLAGPLVIEEEAVTLPVAPGHTVTVDAFGNYCVRLGGSKEDI